MDQDKYNEAIEKMEAEIVRDPEGLKRTFKMLSDVNQGKVYKQICLFLDNKSTGLELSEVLSSIINSTSKSSILRAYQCGSGDRNSMFPELSPYRDGSAEHDAWALGREG